MTVGVHIGDNEINLRSGPQMREYEQIADRITAAHPGRVLDWGCGHGQLTRLLLDRGVDVVAYDYLAGSPPTVLELPHFPGLEQHVSGHPVRLPFADGEFDTVVSCGVLEHVQHPAESLTELRRVLVPGGRLLVYKLPNRFSYLEALARRLGMYYHGALPDDRVYDQRSASVLLTSRGFRVDRTNRANMLPLTVEHPLAWRLREPIWRANVALGRIPGLSVIATNLELEATAV